MQHKVIIVISYVFLNSLYSLLSAQTPLPCNKNSEKRVDAIVAKTLIVGNSGRNFPENDAQVGPFCNETFEMLKVIKEYSKNCMQNLAKQVASVLVYTVESQLKGQLCRGNSKRKQELLESAKCTNAAKSEFNKCFSNFIDGILGAKNADDKLKIPYICCQYQSIRECINTRGKRVSVCTEKHLQTITQFSDSLAGNTLDLLCGEYDNGSDKCAQLGSPPKKTKNQRRTKSFFMPLIDILSSFPEA